MGDGEEEAFERYLYVLEVFLAGVAILPAVRKPFVQLLMTPVCGFTDSGFHTPQAVTGAQRAGRGHASTQTKGGSPVSVNTHFFFGLEHPKKDTLSVNIRFKNTIRIQNTILLR